MENRKEILKQILGLLDLTTLEGNDNTARIAALCQKAKTLNVAAVCVYPTFVKQVRHELAGCGIQTASVAGAFPSGQAPLELRIAEVLFAISQGADEIDMVISRGKFLEKDFNYVKQEIAEHKRACGPVHLKVILETGELQTSENIRLASQLAIENGADFIKTSTGKIQPAATLEAVEVMLQVIREHFEKTGKKVGIKAAGGISTPDQALEYYALVKKLLGNDWLSPQLFRIGASRLADGIVLELGS